MERTAMHQVPLMDVPDAGVPAGDRIDAAVAAPHRSHLGPEASDHTGAKATSIERIRPCKSFGARQILHISFEMAIATGLITFHPTDVLRAARDPALRRRR